MTEKYNGWTNYETWAVNLWLENDQGAHDYYRAMASGFEKGQAYELGKQIKELVEQETDSLIEKFTENVYGGMISDIFHANLSLVDWTEIAEAFLED